MHEHTTSGKKLSEERFSVLCCVNSDGLSRLKLVVLSRYSRQRPLKDCINHLPVHYYHSKDLWFTMAVFKDWPRIHFVPAACNHKENDFKLPVVEVKTLLFLDNALGYPNGE